MRSTWLRSFSYTNSRFSVYLIVTTISQSTAQKLRIAYRLPFRVKTSRDACDAVDNDGGGGDADDSPYIKLNYSVFSVRVGYAFHVRSVCRVVYKQIFYSLTFTVSSPSPTAMPQSPLTPALQTQHSVSARSIAN